MAINDGLTISVRELFALFPDAEAARKYIESRIWMHGQCCPFCGNTEKIVARNTGRKKGFYRCGACKKDFSALKGTVFESSHIPLDKWIHGMYLLLTARKGISSLQLSKELSISQPAAWFLLHRLREAAGNEMETLSGTVQIDECFVGGRPKNKRKSNRKKGDRGDYARVLGMREESGRVRAMPIANGTAQAIGKEILTTVELGSTIYTDESHSYDALEYHYRRESVRHHMEEYVREDGVTTNAIESVWAVLKRGIHGVYHHTSKKHLARYVNEFAFRLNDGNVKTHVLLRLNALVDQCVGKRITFKELTAS